MDRTAEVDNFLDNLLGAENAGPDDAVQYGVKGMRWGVRKPPGAPPGPASVVVKSTPGKKVKTAGGQRQPASDDAVKAAVGKQIAKKSSTDALSNKELQAVVQRMQLEANYKRLTNETKSPGRKFIEKMITDKKARESATTAAGQIRNAIDPGTTIKKTDLSKIGK